MQPDNTNPNGKVNDEVDPHEPLTVNIEECRIEALNYALDRILRPDGAHHLYRQNCNCRFCYRQRVAMEAVSESTELVA